MGRIIGQPTYFKYSELNNETVLVENGVYQETTEGTYGPQHFFREKESGEVKCLNGAGQLNFKLNQIIEGDACKITFLGKTEITKGAMKGKQANSFQVEVLDEAPVVTKAPASTSTLNELE